MMTFVLDVFGKYNLYIMTTLNTWAILLTVYDVNKYKIEVYYREIHSVQLSDH